ncbi:hypothetical protein KN63_05035 [Smithella sp. F21]|jgi:hypothetical protein|nr:hypothetical protein KN63_05035 [Smithella sp. F21]
MKKVIYCMAIGMSFFFAFSIFAANEYEIEVSHNDELFIINGEKFEAKTYCFNMEEGDHIIFLEGSPYGACATAKLLNLRTKKICEVWCE